MDTNTPPWGSVRACMGPGVDHNPSAAALATSARSGVPFWRLCEPPDRSQHKKPPPVSVGARKKSGDDLLSHTATRAVSSALEGLTTVFGMRTGVAPPLQSPESEQLENGHRTKRPTRHGVVQQKILGQASRPISTGQLNPLPDLHFLPINLVISEGSSAR